LAPEGIEKSISGPRAKKVVHHCPRALRALERLTRNPKKLVNTGGRCWKDTLGRQETIGHRLARDQDTLTGRNLYGKCQGGPEGETYRQLPGLVK